MKNIYRVLLSFVLVLSPILVGLPPAKAAVDTCTWTGSASANWSNGGNWTGCDNGGVPENGDTLVFPVSASNKTNNNDLVGLDLDEIRISGTDYVISGNSLTISPAVNSVMQFTNTSGNNDYQIDTTISGGSVAISQDDGPGLNTVSGDLTFSISGDMNFYNYDTSSFVISGNRSGSSVNVNYYGNINLSGAGTNTYTGGVNVTNASGRTNSSALTVSSLTALGSGNPNINVNSTSTSPVGINFFTAGSYSNNINLVGSDFAPELSSNGNVTLSGNVSANSDLSFIKPQSGTLTLSGGLNVNQDLEIEMSPSTNLTKSGASPIAIANNTALSINSLGSYPGPTITVSSAITGSSSTAVNVSGETFLNLNASSNSYDGTFTANNNAIIRPLANTALGTTVGSTTINNSSVLWLSGSYVIPENITVTGTGRPSGAYSGGAIWSQLPVGDSSTELSGTITLNGNTTFAMDDPGSAAPDDEFILSGPITGSGNLTLLRVQGTNSTRFNFLQTSPNTYSGKTILQGSTLDLNGGAQTIPNDIDINSTPTQSASLGLSSNDDIADDSVITLNDDSTPGTFASLFMTSTATSDLVGTINGNGTVCFNNAGQTLNIGGGNISGSFSGFLCSTGTDVGLLNKVGSGSWELASGSTYESATNAPSIDVEGGTLAVNSNFSATTTNVGSGATIKGNGTVGNLSVAPGTLAPGNSPGCFTADGLGLAADSNFNVEIAGNDACSGYDRASANNANLLGVNLNVAPSYQPAVGTVFTIIQAGSVTGTFNGLPNGAKFTTNGLEFQINYTGTQVNLTMLGGTLASTGQNSNQIALVALSVLILSLVGLAVERFSRKPVKVNVKS